MALRVKHKLVVQISGDTAQKKKRFFLEEGTEQETDVASFDRSASGDLSIADTVTESLPFGDVTAARGLYLEVDKPCNVKINGSATSIPVILAPAPSGGGTAAPTAKLFLEATLTAVTIENTDGSGAVLTGSFVLWGDTN